ncbi:MAG: hypothetical protein JJU27_07230 [Gammaproteobacteria bacterium]|nr:hypothetical protein [Gammaproteobacteria bacterium]
MAHYQKVIVRTGNLLDSDLSTVERLQKAAEALDPAIVRQMGSVEFTEREGTSRVSFNVGDGMEWSERPVETMQGTASLRMTTGDPLRCEHDMRVNQIERLAREQADYAEGSIERRRVDERLAEAVTQLEYIRARAPSYYAEVDAAEAQNNTAAQQEALLQR